MRKTKDAQSTTNAATSWYRVWTGRLAGAMNSLQAGEATSAVPHFTPKAKRVIFLFMNGAPSHVDTF